MSWVIAWREHLVLAGPASQQALETTTSVEAALKFETYKAARVWAVDLWGEGVFVNTSRTFAITVDQLIALHDWRSRHGTHWRMWLKKEWNRGDCKSELRQLRNMFGPEWLHKQRLVR